MSLYDSEMPDAPAESKAGTFLLAAAIGVLVLGAVTAPLALFTVRGRYVAAERDRAQLEAARAAQARQVALQAPAANVPPGAAEPPLLAQPPVGGKRTTASAIGQKAEERSEPKTAEERLVKKYIVDHANDPDSLRFVKWGPHDPDRKLSATLPGKFTGLPDGYYVRVCYRAKNHNGAMQFYDALVVVQGARVKGAVGNGYGDDWQEHFDKLFKDPDWLLFDKD
jgi:hypothetical protein